MRNNRNFPLSLTFALTVVAFAAALGCNAQQYKSQTDIPDHFTPPCHDCDFEKRVEMIPMRDGVKLYTVIVVAKGAKNAPIVLTRTPYNAAGRASRSESQHMLDALPLSDQEFVQAGFIRVYQDVRGKYGSEGGYIMTPPPVGPLNTTGTDDTTDAWDTIDWLVKNVKESNGRVGMIGSSYEGFTVVMALLNPHPALKVAAPESPMIDGWMGDDWSHYGAMRQTGNLDYIIGQETSRGGGMGLPGTERDDYTEWLKHGSTGDYAVFAGIQDIGFTKMLADHQAYDAYWQGLALDKQIAKTPLTVPTLWEQGLWDQEDMWGAIHSYTAWEPQDKNNDKNFLVMGPWRHSQINRTGTSLGSLKWDSDTALQYRRDVILPFFKQYLVEGAPKADTPPVWIYNTGEKHWERYASWPQSCESNCPHKAEPLYLTASNGTPGAGGLSFVKPQTTKDASRDYDEFISDPAKPVPYRARPVVGSDYLGWGDWLVADQRFVDGRPDVLTYVSEPLTEPLKLSGAPVVNLNASTSGTDADWAVKLIDVFPGTVPEQPEMGGYELSISLDIFRGRYHTSFEHPQPIESGKPLLYQFTLPTVNHVLLPGHRLMVQVQSTLFPLYDRNPQKYVENIFWAKPGDYQKATERVYHIEGAQSFIELPVVK
jgi:putative CocE/NonD family hydrolase